MYSSAPRTNVSFTVSHQLFDYEFFFSHDDMNLSLLFCSSTVVGAIGHERGDEEKETDLDRETSL